MDITKKKEKARQRYQNLSDEVKNKKRKYGRYRKDIEIVLKKKETKSICMAVNKIEIFQKMKNKGYLSIEKNYSTMQKLIKTS